MFITKTKLSRRTVLRGMGAALGLPLLEAMVPALTPIVKTAGNPVKRFGAIFVPLGERPGYWTPKTVGSNFEFSPILKPLEPFRNWMTVISELCDPHRRPRDDGGGVVERHDSLPHHRRKRPRPGSPSIRSSRTRSGRTRRCRRSSSPPRTSPAGSAAATRSTAAPT